MDSVPEKKQAPKVKREGKLYEASLLIDSSLSEEKATELFEKLSSLASKGGTLIRSEPLYLRNLAYALSRGGRGRKEWFSTAYFGWIIFENTPEHFLGFEKELSSHEEVLRYLTLHISEDALLQMEKRALEKRDEVKQEGEEVLFEEEAPASGVPGVSEEELEKKLQEIVA